MRRTLTACLVLLLLVGSTRGALADELDTVVLRDGTLLRGRAAEVVPGQRVTIQLVTGEIRVVPFPDIASLAGPAFPPAPGAVPVAPPVMPDQHRMYWLTPSPGRAPLELRATRSEQDVSVVTGDAYGVVGNRYASWSSHLPLCQTPCTVYVPPGRFPLLVSQRGFMARRYDIDVEQTGTEVTFRGVKVGQAWGGLFLASYGIIGMLGGVIVGPIGLTASDSSATRAELNDKLMIGGFTTLGIGAAMFIPGVILLHRNKGGIERQRALGLAQGKLVF
jgi:hypothetical protein